MSEVGGLQLGRSGRGTWRRERRTCRSQSGRGGQERRRKLPAEDDEHRRRRPRVLTDSGPTPNGRVRPNGRETKPESSSSGSPSNDFKNSLTWAGSLGSAKANARELSAERTAAGAPSWSSRAVRAAGSSRRGRTAMSRGSRKEPKRLRRATSKEQAEACAKATKKANAEPSILTPRQRNEGISNPARRDNWQSVGRLGTSPGGGRILDRDRQGRRSHCEGVKSSIWS